MSQDIRAAIDSTFKDEFSPAGPFSAGYTHSYNRAGDYTEVQYSGGLDTAPDDGGTYIYGEELREAGYAVDYGRLPNGSLVAHVRK